MFTTEIEAALAYDKVACKISPKRNLNFETLEEREAAVQQAAANYADQPVQCDRCLKMFTSMKGLQGHIAACRGNDDHFIEKRVKHNYSTGVTNAKLVKIADSSTKAGKKGSVAERGDFRRTAPLGSSMNHSPTKASAIAALAGYTHKQLPGSLSPKAAAVAAAAGAAARAAGFMDGLAHHLSSLQQQQQQQQQQQFHASAVTRELGIEWTIPNFDLMWGKTICSKEEKAFDGSWRIVMSLRPDAEYVMLALQFSANPSASIQADPDMELLPINWSIEISANDTGGGGSGSGGGAGVQAGAGNTQGTKDGIPISRTGTTSFARVPGPQHTCEQPACKQFCTTQYLKQHIASFKDGAGTVVVRSRLAVLPVPAKGHTEHRVQHPSYTSDSAGGGSGSAGGDCNDSTKDAHASYKEGDASSEQRSTDLEVDAVGGMNALERRRQTNETADKIAASLAGGGVNRNGRPIELLAKGAVVAVRNTYGKFWLAQLATPLYGVLQPSVEVQWYESTQQNPLLYKFTNVVDQVAAASIHPDALKIVKCSNSSAVEGQEQPQQLWRLEDPAVLDELEQRYSVVAGE